MSTCSLEVNQEEEKIIAPYGSWKSPITADVASGASKLLGGTATDAVGRLIWLESRPNESGRMVLVREPEREGDEPVDITPKDYEVRTIAQGSETGGAFSVSREANTLVFSNYIDQRLYKQPLNSNDSCPIPLTPDYGGPVVSYADGVFDARFNRYVTLREYARQSSTNPTTTIVAVEFQGKEVCEPEVLVGGSDFYAFPRLDPKGERLAWIEWSHPNMPWDHSQLWVGYLSQNGHICKCICVAGCDPSIPESPTEPKWSPKGELYFITDRQNGYRNLYKWVESNNGVISVYTWVAEFSRPLWNFGMNSSEFIQSHEQKIIIACSYRQNGRSYLGILDDVESSLSLLDIPLTDIDNIVRIISCSLSFGAKAVGIVYLSFTAGGPTFESRGVLDLSIQYWTSRGWAFVSVNYGGSTGYGREYRERLSGKWGVVDVNDCCSCARYMVDSGKVDGNRLCITGDSAGGYTTFAALAFRDTFKAGASLYGIADLKLLRAETHKFESHYIDNLVGSEKEYFDRSPINLVDKFSCPIILFQGLEDKSVPPIQARTIYHALKEKGLPVALVEYEGEGHGFRKAENIKFTLEQQMVFFARLVGHFNVADGITPIKIENFD